MNRSGRAERLIRRGKRRRTLKGRADQVEMVGLSSREHGRLRQAKEPARSTALFLLGQGLDLSYHVATTPQGEKDMGTRWERPTVTTDTIAGGYVLVRSHGFLALWQSYLDGDITLLDIRTALAATEARHRTGFARVAPRAAGQAPPQAGQRLVRDDTQAIQELTKSSDARKTRAAIKRLANAGVPCEQLVSRTGTALHVVIRSVEGVADRPVPVPRRWLRSLAAEGSASNIAVCFAHLLRGSFLYRGIVKLGGTCSAGWVAEVLSIDERTAKTARRELCTRGWVELVESPIHHRQRYGSSFILQVPEPVGCTRTRDAREKPTKWTADAPDSPPRNSAIVPGSPPPMENKNLPLRGSENQNRPSGDCTWQTGVPDQPTAEASRRRRKPTMTDIVRSDLEVPGRTADLFADAQRRGWIGGLHVDRLRFFTTAQHALNVGNEPCALFAALARRGCWHHGTLKDEDTARSLLGRLDNGASGGRPQPATKTLAPSVGPAVTPAERAQSDARHPDPRAASLTPSRASDVLRQLLCQMAKTNSRTAILANT